LETPLFNIFNKNAWINIIVGILLGVGIYFNEWLQNLVYPVITTAHELGHTFAGWLLAYPSIPYFDFRQGTGVTVHGPRNFMIFISIYVIFTGLGWYYRHHLFILIILLISVLSYPWIAFSELSQTIILVMGHGTELALSGLMWYLALTGNSGWQVFYAMLGSFIMVYDLSFAYKLMYDNTYQMIYTYQGHGDFSQLAEMYCEGKVNTVANIFFWCCWLPPLTSFIISSYRR